MTFDPYARPATPSATGGVPPTQPQAWPSSPDASAWRNQEAPQGATQVVDPWATSVDSLGREQQQAYSEPPYRDPYRDQTYQDQSYSYQQRQASHSAPPRPAGGVRSGIVAGLLAGLLAGVAGGVGVVAADRVITDRQDQQPVFDASGPGGQPAIPAPDLPPEDAGAVARIAAQVLPSVVSVETTSATGQGSGSGFVIDGDGLILTNNHVIADAADGGEITVVFSGGSQSQAEVVGRNSDYDLAVLRVDRSGLPVLELGDSDEVVVGQPVVAIGAPLGLASTVTTGIVSALNRPVAAGGGEGQPAFINAIQTDAAINPGNSGGPLVSLDGRVIGINSAIARIPGSGNGNVGLGFAIPSNQAQRTATQLIETGRATYPVVGILLDQQYTGEGVKIAEESSQGTPPITPGGPADDAGIRAGDVVLAIDGRPVTQPDELIVSIRARQPGDSVELTVRRDGEVSEITVTLDESG